MSIIKVEKLVPGWEAIPNNFANDTNLSEDAVAVGLWLAIRPAGWQVRPIAIQTAFSQRPGKKRGREWWSRVSGELKRAGYLHLKGSKDAKGQFSSSWHFCVFGLREFSINSGSADAGSAAHGSTDSGSSHISIQHESNSTHIKHTQHKDDIAQATDQAVCVEVEALLAGISLSAGQRKLIFNNLIPLDPKLQIAVTREFISHRNNIRNPVPWIRQVCSDTLFAGEFIPAAGLSQAKSSSIPTNLTCELNGCKKYASIRSRLGWRCAQHIAK
jgi:hypothetical protein